MAICWNLSFLWCDRPGVLLIRGLLIGLGTGQLRLLIVGSSQQIQRLLVLHCLVLYRVDAALLVILLEYMSDSIVLYIPRARNFNGLNIVDETVINDLDAHIIVHYFVAAARLTQTLLLSGCWRGLWWLSLPVQFSCNRTGLLLWLLDTLFWH